MEINAENIDLIDQYINGELTGIELSAFESHMQDNEDFRQAVEAQKIAIARIRHRAALKKMQQIRGTVQEEKPQQLRRTGIRRLNLILTIAAAITLLIIGFISIPKIIEENKIVQDPQSNTDVDKYGSNSLADFSEILTVRHIKVIDGTSSEITNDRKIKLTVQYDQEENTYYDFQEINNDLYILMNNQTQNSEILDPQLVHLEINDSILLYLKLNNQFYRIENGKNQSLIREEDQTKINHLK